MEKLEQAFFQNLCIDNVEFGGIGLDSKRPFGNSDVETDILEIIGAEPEGDDGYEECFSSAQREYARDLYSALIGWLQKKHGNGKSRSYLTTKLG
jgi:hypothetical protein